MKMWPLRASTPTVDCSPRPAARQAVAIASVRRFSSRNVTSPSSSAIATRWGRRAAPSTTMPAGLARQRQISGKRCNIRYGSPGMVALTDMSAAAASKRS